MQQMPGRDAYLDGLLVEQVRLAANQRMMVAACLPSPPRSAHGPQKGFQADVVFIFTFAILGFFLGFAAELDIPAIGENLGGTSCHVSIKVPGAAVVAGRSQVYQLAILGPRHATEMLHAGATGIKFHRQMGDKRLWSDIDGSFQPPLPRLVTR